MPVCIFLCDIDTLPPFDREKQIQIRISALSRRELTLTSGPLVLCISLEVLLGVVERQQRSSDCTCPYQQRLFVEKSSAPMSVHHPAGRAPWDSRPPLAS